LPKILIIDDNADNLISAKALIKNLEPTYKVLTAENGPEGIQLCMSEQPDTILLDVQMPRMDGFEVCRFLKADKNTNHIPIIFLTSTRTTSENKLKGLELGGDAFLTKPINDVELLANLNVMLRIKKAEDERMQLFKEQTEKKYHSIIENIEEGFYEVDLEGNFTFINDAICKMLGFSGDELMGMNNRKYMDEKSARKVHKIFNGVFNSGEPNKPVDIKIRQKGGEINFGEISISLRKDTNGNPAGFRGIVRDITKGKQAEQLQSVVYQISKAATGANNLNALYELIHKTLSQVLDVANFYIAYYDEPLNLISFPFYKDIQDSTSGTPRPLGRGLTEYIMKTGKPLLLSRKTIEEYALKGEIDVVGTLPEQWMGAPLLVADKKIGAIGLNSYDKSDLYSTADLEILTFVSEQIAQAIQFKQTLTELEIDKSYLNELFIKAPEAIVLVTADSTILHINQEFTDLFGYTEKECLNNNIDMLLTNDKNRNEALKNTQNVAKGKRLYFETERQKKDGTMFSVSILASPIQYKGGVFAVYVVYRDITDRKKAETQLRNSEMKHRVLSQELDEANSLKETLLDIISHDLKNPAGSILGFSELLQADFIENELVSEIRDSSINLIKVIDSVSTLSKVSTGKNIELKPLDFVAVIKEVSKEYKSQFSNNHMELKLNLPEGLIVKANPIISEVFKNYISNSIKYAADGKKVIINCVTTEKNITINIIDYGKTIPPKKRKIIFDRGHQLSTKEKRGRGLGLSIVKKIAEAHNGEVGVIPNKPSGNIFYIKIPLS